MSRFFYYNKCIEKAYKYIIENTRWKAEIRGIERVEIPEIPLEDIREIVVNNFSHMRVNSSSFNEIYITPTKIHVYNPCLLVKGKSPEGFANGTNGLITRNPLINTVLYLNKTIDSFDTGFGRVFNICKKKKLITNMETMSLDSILILSEHLMITLMLPKML